MLKQINEYFSNITRWIKACCLWAFKHRGTTLPYVKKGLDIISYVAKLTPTKKDDEGLKHLVKKVEQLTQNLSEDEKKRVVNALDTTQENALSDLKVSLDKKKLKISLGGFGVQYNPDNGDVSFGIG